ncbi:MFS transporter [Lacibacterium aquatile]|uniref:MFS transporter n=1 Tax=Lacibacterium aquatile TaxID=1168082 RepID=A0ABW5DXH5_9PROT
MTAAALQAEPKAAQRAVRLFFLVCGIGNAAWAPMVPFLKVRLGLDDAMLGLVMLALGTGGTIAMPLAGVMIHKIGTRLTMTLGGLLFAASLPLLALAPSFWILAASLGMFGFGLGMLDVSMNAQAVIVEKLTPRPLMSGFHGMFSVGGLVGAAGLSGLLALGLSLTSGAVLVTGLLLLIIVTQFRDLLPMAQEPRSEKGEGLRWPGWSVIAIGLLCCICFQAEGAVLDWSAVFLRFSRGMEEATAGYGYAAFSVAMAAARLTGDRITSRLGPTTILRVGGSLAALGFLIAVATPWVWASMVGFFLVGLGCANVVPVLFSAAGRLPGVSPGVAIPIVASLGYAGILLGPPVLGFVANVTSLSFALGCIAAALLIVAASARIARA